jgi:hypothetical protein
VTLRLVPRRQLLLRVCDARAEDSLLDLRFLSFYGSQQRALEAARGWSVAPLRRGPLRL